MTDSWGDLFERATAYDVDLERIRAADERLREGGDETDA